eukprot:scaffold44178_cov21-Tisochrysis_lutea.AAC.1
MFPGSASARGPRLNSMPQSLENNSSAEVSIEILNQCVQQLRKGSYFIALTCTLIPEDAGSPALSLSCWQAKNRHTLIWDLAWRC